MTAQPSSPLPPAAPSGHFPSAATPSSGSAASGSSTLDPLEVERFSKLAAEWWNPKGKFRPLHQIGPPRLSFIREQAIAHFGRDPKTLKPLEGLTALDIGCGGGLVSEPMTRMGARVTGIDPAARNIAIASAHAGPQGLAIDYRPARIEDLTAQGETFDLVVCLEVVEHVPDVAAFVRECARAAKPGGLVIVSTINRTLKAYALAIVGAEYILGWLPRGTHQWERFVTPDEMTAHVTAAGLSAPEFSGMTYNPLSDTWSLNPDTSVNYLAAAAKPV